MLQLTVQVLDRRLHLIVLKLPVPNDDLHDTKLRTLGRLVDDQMAVTITERMPIVGGNAFLRVTAQVDLTAVAAAHHQLDGAATIS